MNWPFVSLAEGLTNPVEAGMVEMAYAKEWNDLAWRESLVRQLTSSKYFDNLTSGNAVTIPVEPIVAVRNYVEGAADVMDRVVPATQTISIDQAKDWNTGIGPISAQYMFMDMLKKYGDGGRKSMEDAINVDVFGWMQGKAAALNRGLTAGKKTQQWNLGTQASPVKVAPSNIVAHLLKLLGVLTEQNLSKDEVNIVLPAVMEWLYLQSPLANAAFSGNQSSSLMSGDLGKLGGRGKYHVSNFVTGTGTQADPFCVMALTKQAVAFTQRLMYTRLWKYANGDVSSQGLMVWGRGVIKSWAMAEAWFYVDETYAPTV